MITRDKTSAVPVSSPIGFRPRFRTVETKKRSLDQQDVTKKQHKFTQIDFER